VRFLYDGCAQRRKQTAVDVAVCFFDAEAGNGKYFVHGTREDAAWTGFDTLQE
jgi:hypothetical protein